MRNLHRALPAVLLLFLSVLPEACGGDGEPAPTDTLGTSASPSPTVAATASPSQIPSPTASPAVTASPAPAPEAPAIVLAPAHMLFGVGLSARTLAAGEVMALDARDFSEELGVSITSCLDTAFYLTWQVRDPYPPDGIVLEFYQPLRGSRDLVAAGASGQLTDGACVALEMVNTSAFGVTVSLRYAFAE